MFPSTLLLALSLTTAAPAGPTVTAPRASLASRPAASTTGAVAMLAPGRGTEWAPGSSQQILWHRRGRLGPTVGIVLLRKGQAEQAIIPATPNSGVFTWTVPATLAPGTYRVAVVTTDRGVRGTSDLFRVVAPPRTGSAALARKPALSSSPGPAVAGPPVGPSGLFIPKRGSTQQGAGYDFVGLMWRDNAINESGYIVERWGGPGCEAGYTVVGRLPADATSFEDVGVDPRAETYWWRVRAWNLRGGSGYASISIQNDVQNNAVGGTAAVEVPQDPSEVCKEAGGVWLGWGIDYCSQALSDIYSAGQILANPLVHVYMAYFAKIGRASCRERVSRSV
jgi:hypothetical protein